MARKILVSPLGKFNINMTFGVQTFHSLTPSTRHFQSFLSSVNTEELNLHFVSTGLPPLPPFKSHLLQGLPCLPGTASFIFLYVSAPFELRKGPVRGEAGAKEGDRDDYKERKITDT